MAVTRQKKQEILKELEKDLKTAKVVIFVNFHGLSVKLANELRKMLKKTGVKYLVAKKTLLKKVLGAFSFEGDLPELEGEIGIAVSELDSLETIKTLQQFAKKNKTLKLTAGIWENKYIDGEKVMALANIPSREILLSQLVNIIKSPVQRLVVTLNSIAKK